jgi:multisubunit Na+/H+ antiporter MnhB subunit
MPYLVLIVACYRFQRFEITQKSSFNYQGFSFLSLVPAGVVSTFAILLFNAFSLFDFTNYAYYTFIIIGIMGIITYKWWLKSITRKFEEQKYKLAEGFREK